MDSTHYAGSRSGARSAREAGFWVLVALIVIFCVLPFVWTLITSLKTLSEIYATPATYVPRALTLDHWEKVLTLTRFTKSLLNSTIVSGGATVLCLFVSALAAYAFAFGTFPGRQALFLAVVARTFLLRKSRDFDGMAEQFREIVERVRLIELAGVD